MCAAARAVALTAAAPKAARGKAFGRMSSSSDTVARRPARAARLVANVTTEASVAADAAETSLADSLRPTSAECAKTLVAIANTGTISTTMEDGVALGTFASYVVTKTGAILLRMRADATHTANIEREPRCSLYVRPSTQPPGVLSRATLIGSSSSWTTTPPRWLARSTTTPTALTSASTPPPPRTSTTSSSSTASSTSAGSEAISAPRWWTRRRLRRRHRILCTSTPTRWWTR